MVAQIDKETVGSLFYNRLFEIAPEVKPMFSRTTLPEQSKKLLTMLSYIINKSGKPEDILDLEAAWIACYTLLSGAMIASCKAVQQVA